MPDRSEIPLGARENAIRLLWQTGDRGGELLPYLYCIIDAARDPGIYPRLQQFAAREEIVSIYQGAGAVELAAVAPYLICLGSSTRMFDWIWREGWGESWGIFFWSLLTIQGLRSHFRRLTKVRTEDGRGVLFRFYDPRVLVPFLPTCDAAQLEMFFGPLAAISAESEGGRLIETFSFLNGRLGRRTTELYNAPARSVSFAARQTD